MAYLDDWVSSNLQCWLKIMTNGLPISTTAILAQALTATYLVCCSDLLIGLLFLVFSF